MIDIPWANTQKIHIQGDFVHILHGPHQGRSGWVVSGVDGYELCCTEEVLQPPEFKTLIVDVRFQQFECFTYIQAIIASSAEPRGAGQQDKGQQVVEVDSCPLEGPLRAYH